MNKIYFVLVFFILVISVNFVYAQAPILSYPTPPTFAINQPIAPISLINTGAPVPNGFYGQSSLIAGDGFYGTKDTTDAASARFGNPLGIVQDASGYIYVADANNNAIRRIAPDGAVVTFAGGGAAGTADGTGTTARFNYPTGLATDNDKNIYVADYGNSRIRKITPDGVVTTILSNGLNLPYGLTIDASNNIIVADTYNNLIKKVTQNGVVTTIAGNNSTLALVNGNGTAATFSLPYGVITDRAGNIYVTDHNHGAVRKITPAGDVTTLSTELDNPTGITIDSLGTLYVTHQTGFISKIDRSTGQSTVFAGQAPSPTNDDVTYADGVDTAARFSGNAGIGYDNDGNIVIADGQNFVVRRVSTGGVHISPQLPDGLGMDRFGTISGTPDSLSAIRTYTVTAYTTTAIVSTTIDISVSNIAPQIITFNPIANKSYASSNFSAGATSTNPTIPIVYTSSNTSVATIVNDTTIHIVAAGTTTITANQPGNANFTVAAPKTQTLTVTQAMLTVTANSQVKITGQANPALTFGYTGFINGDTESSLSTKPTAQTTATTASGAGSYPITISGGAATNYQFTYVPAILTVSATPSISASGQTAFLAGDSVILSVNYPAGYTYQWNYNGSAIAGATSSNYKATISGSFTVSVTANGQTATSAATVVTAAFTLPPQNFKLQINAVTCKGSNNGTVFISAVKHLNYSATIIDAANASTSYPFTDTLTIGKLKPGAYNVCITVTGQTYSQCYSVNITEPKDLSVFSTVNQRLNTVNLQLDGGTSYSVNLNGTMYTTTQNDLTLPLSAGTNKIAITTDKLCQGVVEKSIIINDFIPYPNPFTDALSINIGNAGSRKAQVNIYNVVTGKQVYTNTFNNQSGILQLDLKNIDMGIYYLNLNVDNTISSFKIIKK